MITIQAVSRSGNPLSHVRVGIMWDGVPLHTDGYTDGDGYARFSVRGGPGSIYLDGIHVYSDYIDDDFFETFVI